MKVNITTLIIVFILYTIEYNNVYNIIIIYNVDTRCLKYFWFLNFKLYIAQW